MNNTEVQIATMLKRGVEQIFPSADFLKSRLEKGEKLKIYAGIDPTGPTLHIGHAIVLKKLQQFQQGGHQVIFLIGDFTAQIGDPTDKMAARIQLTEGQVKKNLVLYKKQAGVFIKFNGKNAAKIVHNSSWLKKLNLKDIIELSSLVTVDQMLKRDMFSKRTEEGKPIFIHEFLYPLLHGFDSVMLEVDAEVGGNDQMFNMLVGRDLLKKIKNKEKIAITMKLLADTAGKKMGKTEGNMVSLSDPSQEMFGKIMSWSDGMIVNGFELCTDVGEDEIGIMKSSLESNSVNPRDLKIRLAKEIVATYHGKKAADAAELDFMNTFSKGDIPENILEYKTSKEVILSQALLEKGIIESIGEFKRLVKEGAVNLEDGKKITDFNSVISSTTVVKVGKRRFLKIVF